MKDSENNLKFEYLYRDAGNYKQFGFVIFENPTQMTPDIAEGIITPYLIDGEFFYPDRVQVPRLEKHVFDPEIDLDWYEFEKFSQTDEKATESITVQKFLDRFV